MTVSLFDRIIWSADVADEDMLFERLDRMPELRIVKIDRLFAEDVGLRVVDRLRDRGLWVFDDAKIVEIPIKVRGLAERHLEHRPWMLNCMAGCVSTGVFEAPTEHEVDGLKRFADACRAVGTRPCGVTVLTSKTPEVVRGEFSGRDTIEQVLYYVETLLGAGFTDVVCSPNEVSAIRTESRFDVLDLNTPGIRPAGSTQDDQARADTPFAALAAGATRLVIGRPITLAEDPAESLHAIVEEIATAIPV